MTSLSFQRGFTLLEMIVVLVLSGLLVATVLPNVQRMYGSMADSSDRKVLIQALNQLPNWVREQGLPYTLAQLPDKNLQHSDYNQLFIDKQARLIATKPIFISGAGLCPFGGDVQLELGGRIYTTELKPPRCLWVK